MTVTMDGAGRIVIPAIVRDRLGLRAGTRLELSVDESGIRLAATTPAPTLVRVRGRLVARPTVAKKDLPAVDVAALIEEERNRWP